MSFIHLHVHSHYSLLDGLPKVGELVDMAKAEHMSALALTDHGVMYGAVEFYQKATKAGIKPIIGLEAYVAPNGRLNKRPRIDEVRNHLILLARNETGYKNLIKLTSMAHMEGFYYKPRVDWELLEQYHEGIIASSACLQGEIPQALMADDTQRAKELVAKHQRVFGEGNFYLELQRLADTPESEQVNQALIALARQEGVPLVATNDVHYLEQPDADAQDVLICLQTKRKKDETNRMNLLAYDLSFRSAAAMTEKFADVPEAIANTAKIADMVDFEMTLGEIKLPFFAVPAGKTPQQQLADQSQAGIAKRYGDTPDPVIQERLEYELGVIEKTGYASYFLIVADFVNWAKEQGIIVGPGRGSAAGSLVSYLINITNVDPIKYDLLFERFLNPERVSMPDIDLDFADVRRDEVIRYVESKYGKDHVAQIITFGTMAARAAVRDVGRVLDLPYGYCDKISKLIPMFTSLDEALDKEPELKEMYDNDEEAKLLIDTARRIEGNARHTSTHACGVLITPEPVSQYAPIQYASGSDETVVSQYSLSPVESLGLLKMDFLGLKNLTILENTIDVIKKIHGKQYDLDELPFDDAKTFELFQRGDTTGVFQLESAGMKRYLKQLQPNHIEDIIAMVALYRPGPMEFIPDFVARKHGLKEVSYIHPKLEPILNNTYGIAVYQEQIMRIAQDLAGFTLGEADVLRKAMGKKIASLLAEQKEKFIQGAIDNSIPDKIAKEIFHFIEPFAQYGFNRSHAACYAVIAYQTAYFKANYPVEFMASLLTADQGNLDRVTVEVTDCAAMGITVLPPDINESFTNFTAVAETLNTAEPRIRFGLHAVKNVGEGIVKAIIHERKANGAFTTFEDFLLRVRSKELNKKSLESLAKAGAFGQMIDPNTVLYNMDAILQFIKETHQDQDSNQTSLFADSTTGPRYTLRLADVPAVSKKERALWEREYLGLYITEHPIREFARDLNHIVAPCNQLPQIIKQGREAVRIAGVVSMQKRVFTRKGDPMLFARIEDATGGTEVIVFPKKMTELGEVFGQDQLVIVEGRVSDKDGEMKIVVERAAELRTDSLEKTIQDYSGPIRLKQNHWRNTGADQQQQQQPAKPAAPQPGVFIRFHQPPTQELVDQIKAVIGQHAGDMPVRLLVAQGRGWQSIDTPFTVDPTDTVKELLEQIVGERSVAIVQPAAANA